jgi:hypothetical protein
MYWGLRDHLGEARAWIDQLLPTADSLDPHARAELLWTAAVTALEVVGDDAAALAASQRLAPLLDGITDPYLHAVSQLAMVGISAVVGDVDGALRGELVSLEELRPCRARHVLPRQDQQVGLCRSVAQQVTPQPSLVLFPLLLRRPGGSAGERWVGITRLVVVRRFLQGRSRPSGGGRLARLGR